MLLIGTEDKVYPVRSDRGEEEMIYQKKKRKRIEDMSAKELSRIMKYLGSIYRKAKKRSDLADYSGLPDSKMYEYDRQLIYLIERTLQDCTRENGMILRRTYFENQDENWYAGFLSQSTFYRLKKEATVEFLNCLDY